MNVEQEIELKHELDRLREENADLRRTHILSKSEVIRLHRIEEAARMVLDAPDDIERGKRLFDLRAALAPPLLVSKHPKPVGRDTTALCDVEEA